MSIAGRIDDVSVLDVLQFLHLSGRSGQVFFRSPKGGARLILKRGAVSMASCPELHRTVGQIICERVGRDRAVVEEVAVEQREVKRPLGQMLIERGVCTKEELRDAVTTLIRDVVREVATWKSGTFVFEPDLSQTADDIECVPEEMKEDVGLDVHELLFDALKVLDARNQAREPKANTQSQPAAANTNQALPASKPPAQVIEVQDTAGGARSPFGDPPTNPRLVGPSSMSQTANAAPLVVVITEDGYVQHMLRSLWSERHFATKIFGYEPEATKEISTTLERGVLPIVVMHVGVLAQRDVVATMARLRRTFPRVPVFTFGQVTSEQLRELYRLGVRTHVSLPVRTQDKPRFEARFPECVVEMEAAIDGALQQLRGSEVLVDGPSSDLQRLAQRVEGLHKSSGRASVALCLLEYVAENVDRSVLFLQRAKELVAIGAFGTTDSGQSITNIVVGLRLPNTSSSLMRMVSTRARPYRGDVVSEPCGLTPIFERIGKPRSGKGVLIPVRSVDRVFAVLYADNGTRNRMLVSTDALEVLACQAGLMLENQALKRRLDQSSDLSVTVASN